MIRLPPKPPRKVTETDIVKQCLVAINRIPGVRATRNNVGAYRNERGDLHSYGLGEGSPDIVGIITIGGPRSAIQTKVWNAIREPVAIAFGLEVKRPKLDGGRDPTPAQRAWAKVASSRGMFCGVTRSEADAVEMVQSWIWTLGQDLVR